MAAVPIAGAERVRLPYVQPLISAFRAGSGTDHMHLGYWDRQPEGPVSQTEWAAAQARMTARVIDLAGLKDGQAIADIGCGIGGTLREILARINPGRLIGVNVDPEQLALCPGGAERVQADACDLPFPAAYLDRLISLEAAFHFSSRAAFLASAARVLRPGGRLVLADILLDGEALTPGERALVERALAADLGPWPVPWQSILELDQLISSAGLCIRATFDISCNTGPSYSVVAPATFSGLDTASGNEVVSYLHRIGLLKYIIWVAEL